MTIVRPYKSWRPWFVTWRCGRWSGDVDPHGLILPRLVVFGEGTDYAYAAFTLDNRSSDPVFRVEVDLEGTRLGRVICRVAYWWRTR